MAAPASSGDEGALDDDVALDGHGVGGVGRHPVLEARHQPAVDQHVEGVPLAAQAQLEAAVRLERIGRTGDALLGGPAAAGRARVQHQNALAALETRVDVQRHLGAAARLQIDLEPGTPIVVYRPSA